MGGLLKLAWFLSRRWLQSERRARRLTRAVEAVEKVPKQILGRDAEKSDLTECATINDLMPGKGQVPPKTTG